MQGLDLEWCKTPDAGLPVPDLLLHLELSTADAQARAGFGNERYEVASFQAKVRDEVCKPCVFTCVRSFLYARLCNLCSRAIACGLGGVMSYNLPSYRLLSTPYTPSPSSFPRHRHHA